MFHFCFDNIWILDDFFLLLLLFYPVLKAFSNEMDPKDLYFWIARLHVLAI
jgi:hypothetical protein